MDPASIVGLTVAIQQLISYSFKLGRAIHAAGEAKRDISKLCSELLALKAALEHVQLDLDQDFSLESEVSKDESTTIGPSIFATPEFKAMVSSTDEALKELLAKMDLKSGKFKSLKQKLSWVLFKDDVRDGIARLERAKGWFILATTTENSLICKETYVKICSVDQRLQLQEQQQERIYNSALRKSVETWLAPYSPRFSLENLLETYRRETGSWFLNSILTDWLDQETTPILWLRAKPGSGKTILMSASVERMQARNSESGEARGIAYFFCSFTDQNTQEPKNILGSFLVQLCEACPSYWAEVEGQYQGLKQSLQQEPKRLDIVELERLITQCSRYMSEVVLFLDAVNETTEHHKILRSLEKVVVRSESVRVVLSSTEQLSTTFKPESATIVSMRNEQTSDDIKRYIEACIEEDDNLSDLPLKVKEDIISVLHRKSNGIFRWVQCQLETLASLTTRREIQIALSNVPPTLSQTYRATLSAIPKEHVERARQALFWITFALTPMRLCELAEAVVISESDTAINDDMRLLRDDVLLKICGNLLSFDERSTNVTLAHSSVWKYLTTREIRESDVGIYYLDIETADNAVIRRCVNYMCLPAFNTGYCETSEQLSKRFDEWPLLVYISKTLFAHLTYVKLDAEIKECLLRFFTTHDLPRGGNFGAWVQAFVPAASHNIEASTPLYYASSFGLLPVVRLILSITGTKDLEVAGGVHLSTPLHVAAWRGHTDVVEELLKAGANAKETNINGESGLLWARNFCYRDMEKLLREAGATLQDMGSDRGWSSSSSSIRSAAEDTEVLESNNLKDG